MCSRLTHCRHIPVTLGDVVRMALVFVFAFVVFAVVRATDSGCLPPGSVSVNPYTGEIVGVSPAQVGKVTYDPTTGCVRRVGNSIFSNNFEG